MRQSQSGSEWHYPDTDRIESLGKVARILFDDILQKLASRAGNERKCRTYSALWTAEPFKDDSEKTVGEREKKKVTVHDSTRLLPLNYGRILRTGEGNALPLQARS